MYNPWPTKTIWISQITTYSSLKPGSSLKVLIDQEPEVLRIWNVWKTRQLFVKIKFAPDTDIGRHEWHAGGNDIMSASGASHLDTGDVLKKQALVGTARKALSLVWSYWELFATQPITDAVHIKN
jgi:hypothetical protein